MVADEISRAELARERASESVGAVLEGALAAGRGSGELSQMSAAWLAWGRVNGDVERSHTAGVFVAPPRRGEKDPELVVYVDSGACVTDFSANREVYLARLESVGMHFSKITFRRSKYPVRRAAGRRPAAGAREDDAAPELPELTPAESRRIDELAAGLPETLRESVSRAMRVSVRAQKQQNS